jgi:SMI1/KNR4 family protein
MFNGCNIIGKNTWEMKNFNEGATLYILDKDEVDFFKNTVKINFIPLLNDGFGNYYGVSENGKIGFFNHDSGNVEDVADTWSNFLSNKNL